MSDQERIELFVREPMSYLAKAVPDAQVRSSRLFTAADDPAVETARRWTLNLAATAVASALLGLPILWLTAGVVRRTTPDLLDWSIVAFWLVLLALAVRRSIRTAVLVLLILASLGSIIGILAASALA